MIRVKRLTHRLARGLWRCWNYCIPRAELEWKFNHSDASLHAMTHAWQQERQRREDVEALLAVLTIPVEVKR